MSALRFVAPAGTALTWADLGSLLRPFAAGESPRAALARELSAAYGVPHCYFFSTGRAAMTLVFKAMAASAPRGRDEVVMPSYTCYSVPAAAAKAGLRVRVCDVDPETLDYDYDRLKAADFSRTLAVVSANLYGIPNDLARIRSLAREHDVFFLDDAAQAMGACVDGVPAGTWGDAGLFSFDKGKNITSIQGGVAVTRSDALASHLEAAQRGLATTRFGEHLVLAAQVLAYALFLRPGLYGIPQRIPALKLGETRYCTDYPLQQYPEALAGVALSLFRRIGEINRQRVRNATALLDELQGVRGLMPVAVRSGIEPVYLRLPLLVHDPVRRERLLERLRRAGVGATASYPRSIASIDELAGIRTVDPAGAAGGMSIATRIVTLPTHQYVLADDRKRMVAIVRETLEG